MISAAPTVDSIKSNYDFWRCHRCQRLVTKVEEHALMATGKFCPCGSDRAHPANLPWYGWFLPRVWVFAYLRLRGRA